MRRRLLLGVPDSSLGGELAALAQEGLDVDVVAVVADGDAVASACAEHELDAVVLHEDLGPLPVIDLARELAAAHPRTAFLLLVRHLDPDLLRGALRAGVRDVLALPVTVEALAEAIERATSVARALTERMDDESLAAAAGSVGGRIVVLAGAKGGVGTTTLALHLALAAAAEDPDRTVCLAELDLQAGDVRTFLDLPARRSVVDLVGVGEDLNARSLDDVLYVHAGGLRVLLAPEHGEDGEEVDSAAARRIVGALKFQYDLVVVDAGSVMTDANAVAVELADAALVVTTPDVPALRAANRLLALWSRLRLREDDEARVVLNRLHRDSEVQPDLARRVLTAELTEARIPAAFRELEPAVNAGLPGRLEAGGVARGVRELAAELALVTPQRAARRLRLRSSVGQTAVETIGLTWLIVLIVVGLWQVALTGYTYVIAGHAARAAVRSLAVGEDPAASAKQDLPSAWRGGMHVRKGTNDVDVSLRVPLVLPGVDTPITVSQHEGTVVEAGG